MHHHRFCVHAEFKHATREIFNASIVMTTTPLLLRSELFGEDVYNNFVVFKRTNPYTLQRCLAELLDIFRWGLFYTNPKICMQSVG